MEGTNFCSLSHHKGVARDVTSNKAISMVKVVARSSSIILLHIVDYTLIYILIGLIT